MKKNYISPEVMVDNIELAKVLCLSIVDGGYADGTQDVLTKEIDAPAVDDIDF